ncbi:DUF1223 domain-containing protein [Paracoccus pacificus]|uniref:DUF1223 domain-containing protein n=1 Tax=Paracoccus pacificus TaxID=1463598 RepID=A0ABW4R7Q9_9RHOB
MLLRAVLVLSVLAVFAAQPLLAQDDGITDGQDTPDTISAQEGKATVSADEMESGEFNSELGAGVEVDPSEAVESSALDDPNHPSVSDATAAQQSTEPPTAEAVEDPAAEAADAANPGAANPGVADTARSVTAPAMTPTDVAPPGMSLVPETLPDQPAAAAPAPSAASRSKAPRSYGPVSQPLVVVELFTAQGCSSCPPADVLLGDLSDDRDVLALAFHVDYWDYLGWADPFARPEFTERQKSYARAAREHSLYTPQMIVGGTDTLISARPADLMALIAENLSRPPVITATRQQKGDTLITELVPIGASAGPSAVFLIRYVPERKMTVMAGENRGKTMVYRNVVVGIERLADWDGRGPLRLTVQARKGEKSNAYPADTRHALIVQQMKPGRVELPGRILTALRLD